MYLYILYYIIIGPTLIYKLNTSIDYRGVHLNELFVLYINIS